MANILIEKSLASNKNGKYNWFPGLPDLIFKHKANEFMNFFYRWFRDPSIQGKKSYITSIFCQLHIVFSFGIMWKIVQKRQKFFLVPIWKRCCIHSVLKYANTLKHRIITSKSQNRIDMKKKFQRFYTRKINSPFAIIWYDF